MMGNDVVSIRPLELRDLAPRVSWVNDPEVRQTLMFDYPVSLARTERWFRDGLTDETKLHFSIEHDDAQSVIGMTGFLDIDRRNQRAQFYITIGDKSFWGRGVATTVVPIMLQYGFAELNLHKIYLYTLPNNGRARGVYERASFVEEGRLRQHHYRGGEFVDLVQHSVLREDWASNHSTSQQ